MNLIESTLALAIATAISTAAMAAYFNLMERRTFAAIVENAHDMPFNLSCRNDGTLDGRQAGNCFEKAGYRFIREGLGTIIARTQPDGSAEVVYQSHTGNNGGSLRQLEAARIALTRQ